MMQLKPPGDGVDYLPTEEGGLSLGVEIFARVFSVIQTSLIGVSLVVGMFGLIFYLYSRNQHRRGLQFVEGGIIVFTTALCVPLLIETTSFLVDGDTDIGTVQVTDEGYGQVAGALEIIGVDALDTDPNYPAGLGPVESSLDPTVAVFGNILSVLMAVVVSTAVIGCLFALILFFASPQPRKEYALNLLRGSFLLTVGASMLHIILSTLSWIAVGSPSTDRGIQPLELRGDDDASEFYTDIQLPNEAMTPDVIYPLNPGDATIIPTLQITDRIAVLNEVGIAYLAVILLVFATIVYLTSTASSQRKIKARRYIITAAALLIIIAGVSMVITTVGWVATGDISTESTIHQTGAPYADGTYFSSGSAEGWESDSGSTLVPIELDGGMALYIDGDESISRPFEIVDSPGNQVLITVKTQGEAIVSVSTDDETLVDGEIVDGGAAWVSQTDDENLDIEIENMDSDTTLYIESAVVSPVLIEN